MWYRGILLTTILVLGACGGGGGSSGGGTTTGGTSGGTTGGGNTGGGVVTPGGNGFDLDTGIGGSGGIIGDIDGFGSILMNGLTLDTDSAEFYIEGESGFSQDDLSEGQYVIVAGDVSGAIAEEVVYRSNLKGPVSAVPVAIDAQAGEYQLEVLGQTVLTNATTRLDGVILEDIVQNDLLEVSGPIDEQGRVLATYISLKSSLAEYKAIGTVDSLDAVARTFNIGGLLVDYSMATLDDFDGADLADGQLVEVRLATGPFNAASPVEATEVELLPEVQLSEGGEVEIEGVIDSFSSATDFTVGGLPVATNASTVYEGGAVGQLALNVRVEVEGTVNAAGVIAAETIEFEDAPAIRVEGAITDVDVVAGAVTAMGVTFEVRGSTEMEDDRDRVEPFSINDLMDGDYVQIRGYLSDNSVVAVELEREDHPNPGEYRTLLRGPLTAFADSAGTVEIQGVTVNEQDLVTQYEQEEAPLSRTEFFNLLPAALSAGTEITAEWDDFSPANAAPQDAGPADNLSLENDG
jgi:hypothetical protein